VVLPAPPQFVVADRFPPLGTLASIAPPCATVLRFDSSVLFEVGESEVLPQAAAVLAEVAPALIDAGRSIEINGHTDANGSDEYNQQLSQERAQAVADELVALGVDVQMTTTGHGESQPVAPNYNDDGTDDEAGQRQNRRVEIVIHGDD
jgi:OOP family OmpA-OmpF porin